MRTEADFERYCTAMAHLRLGLLHSMARTQSSSHNSTLSEARLTAYLSLWPWKLYFGISVIEAFSFSLKTLYLCGRCNGF